jgi:adenylylsulfate kinase
MSAGLVFWLTGLPGSGKTTIARILEERIKSMHLPVEVLDGDEVRRNLSPELGFTRDDRETHAKRVVYLSKLLSRNGIITIVALISPYRQFRDAARQTIGDHFMEIWVKATSDTCRKRDPKGLYKKAAEGKLAALTGVSDPYEPPLNPELVIDTETESPNESAKKILDYLLNKGYLKGHNLERARIQVE